MTLPSLKDWAFSAKSFAAAALALYVAFLFDLPSPYWAMATVYIVSQPFSGALRAKALWRIIGTLAGGAFTILALPNLVDAPALLCLVFALWVAFCLMASMLDPTPRSYAFMLAGYTAALIGFPSVNAPNDIFGIALSRCEEIGLGILCAWLFHGVLFPRHGAPMLRLRIVAWMGDVARFGALGLRGQLDDASFASERRRMARDSTALTQLFQQARYEASAGNPGLLWVPRLHERARQIPALITFTADRAAALREADPAANARITPLLQDVAAWMERTNRPTGGGSADLIAHRLLERIRAEGEAARGVAAWSGVLHEGLAARLTELVESWRDCAALATRILATEPADLPPPAEAVRMPGHTDPLLVALSGGATALAILIGCAFWILSGWAHGASVPMMAAVATCIFAQLDDPTPAMARFTTGAALSIIAAAVYLFAVFPMIDGFPLLLLVLGLLYLPVGALLANPALAAPALSLAATTPSIMGLQETYSADFAGFMDGALATLLGLSLSLTVIRVLRSFGIAWRVRRLVEADRRDLRRLIEGRRPADLRQIVATMLDRFEALAARLGAVDTRTIGVAELADLRASLNVLRLREGAGRVGASLGALVEAALAALAAELRGRGAKPATLACIDEALLAAMQAGDRGARKAALSLAGLRLALFPEAPAPAAPPPLAEERIAA